jgi:2,3-bisphosphoglycerate-independent phosphoglycerate mutase
MPKAVVLCILDGWGHREKGMDNAIAHARTPHWDELMAQAPHTLLEASERYVGLPEGQMGNSEVGHMSIGAGRVVLQDLPRIDDAIKHEILSDLTPLKDFIKALKKSGGTCHLLGLLSPGGVHSHERHIRALTTLLVDHHIPVAIHAFLDGRDTPPQSAASSLASLLDFLKAHPGATLASMGGRYYGMDRDTRWDRVQKAYEAIVSAYPQHEDALTYLQKSYQEGATDEFVLPTALGSYKGMQEGDGLFMANFRSDRVRQILTALLDPHFQDFKRSRVPPFAATLGMVEYSDTLNEWMTPLFPSFPLSDVLGEVIAHQGLKQLRIAETEKYAHVTFFFNGGQDEAFPGEERLLIPSPQVATYDLKPEMSAYELTGHVCAAIESQKYALIVVNYANTDMVGHTGNFDATQKAVEAVDTCLGRMIETIKNTEACLLITADHGNAEMMYDGVLQSPHTAHTLNPVPFVMFQGPPGALRPGKLSDVAPTILQIMHLPQPSSMKGASLLREDHA